MQPAQQVLRDDLATAGSMVLSGGRLDIVSQTILSVDPPAHLLGDCHRARPRVYVRVVDPEQEMHVMLPAEHPRPPGDTITSRELATPWASRRGSRWRPGIAR
ncbi:hypothetical protein [Streptomyces sp. NPDC001536]|uniref:hypothetical protein n=1 Tax=Streptomyces sp. NPDC001536 TaxID=3364583 RepID=UPI0036876F77